MFNITFASKQFCFE